MSGDSGPTITMTEDLALPGRVALTMMGVSITRRRRILELRAERDRLATELGRVEAAIATEEADLAQENTVTSDLFDQWQRILDRKLAEARTAEIELRIADPLGTADLEAMPVDPDLPTP